MNSIVVKTSIFLAGASMFAITPALFAIDGQVPPSPSGVQAGSTLKLTNPALFMEAANNINRTEIEMGRLAEERGQAKAVRNLGARMVHDHAILENKLKTLATRTDVVLPKQLDAKHQKLVDELNAYTGEAFDRHYVNDQIRGHQKAIALFQDAAAENTQRSVREFAQQTIPILKEHLALSEQAADEVNEPAGAQP